MSRFARQGKMLLSTTCGYTQGYTPPSGGAPARYMSLIETRHELLAVGSWIRHGSCSTGEAWVFLEGGVLRATTPVWVLMRIRSIHGATAIRTMGAVHHSNKGIVLVTSRAIGDTLEQVTMVNADPTQGKRRPPIARRREDWNVMRTRPLLSSQHATIDAIAMVESSGEDGGKWSEPAQAELANVRGTSTLRTSSPHDMKSVPAKGAPTAPAKMVRVLKLGAVPTSVKHRTRLVVCGNFQPKVPGAAVQNLGVAMGLWFLFGRAMLSSRRMKDRWARQGTRENQRSLIASIHQLSRAHGKQPVTFATPPSSMGLARTA